MDYPKTFGKRKKMGNGDKEHEQKENTQNNQKQKYKKNQNILKDSCNVQNELNSSAQYTYNQNEEPETKVSIQWSVLNDKQNSIDDNKMDYCNYSTESNNKKNKNNRNKNKNLNIYKDFNNNSNSNNDLQDLSPTTDQQFRKDEENVLQYQNNYQNNYYNSPVTSDISSSKLSIIGTPKESLSSPTIDKSFNMNKFNFPLYDNSVQSSSSSKVNNYMKDDSGNDRKFYSVPFNEYSDDSLFNKNKDKNNNTLKTTYQGSSDNQTYLSGLSLDNTENENKNGVENCDNNKKNINGNGSSGGRLRKSKKSKYKMDTDSASMKNLMNKSTDYLNDSFKSQSQPQSQIQSQFRSQSQLQPQSQSSPIINSDNFENSGFSRQDGFPISESSMNMTSSKSSENVTITPSSSSEKLKALTKNSRINKKKRNSSKDLNMIGTKGLSSSNSNTNSPMVSSNTFSNSSSYITTLNSNINTNTSTNSNANTDIKTNLNSNSINTNSNANTNINTNTNTDTNINTSTNTSTNVNTNINASSSTTNDPTKTEVEYYKQSILKEDSQENVQNYPSSTLETNNSSNNKNHSMNSNIESLNQLTMTYSSRSQQPLYSSFSDNTSFTPITLTNAIPKFSRYPKDSSNVSRNFFNSSTTNSTYSSSNVPSSNMNNVEALTTPSTNLVSVSKANDMASSISIMSNMSNSSSKPSNTSQTVLSTPSSSLSIRTKNNSSVQNFHNQQQKSQALPSPSLSLIGSSIQQNNQNETNNDDEYSQSYIQPSSSIVLQNSNNYSTIHSMTPSSSICSNTSSNAALSLNSPYIGVNYESKKEISRNNSDPGVILQQHQQQSRTPILYSNNQLSDSISINENQSTIPQQISPLFNSQHILSNQQSNESLSFDEGNKNEMKPPFGNRNTLSNQFRSSFSNQTSLSSSLDNQKLPYDNSSTSIPDTLSTTSLNNHSHSQQVISSNTNNQIIFDGNNQQGSSTLPNYNYNQNISQNPSYNQNQNYQSQVAQNYKVSYLYCNQNSGISDNTNAPMKAEDVDILTTSSFSSCIPTYKDQSLVNNPNSSSFIPIPTEDNMQTLQPDDMENGNGDEQRITLIPWEDKGTYVFQIKVGTKTLSRRLDNHTINGTKLLNIAGLTRGRRDGILKNEKDRNVIKHGPLNLKGVWIPLSRARFITEKHKINPAIYIILEDDPSKYLDKASQYELEGKYEPYIRSKDIYADDDYLANKYSGECDCIIDNCIHSDNIPHSNHHHQEFNPYITQYISNNSLKSNNPINNLCNHGSNTMCSHCINNTELPTENISQPTTQINDTIQQSTNDMNPCDLEFIIHAPEKEYIYNTADHNYYGQSPQNHYQTDMRYDIPVQSYSTNISKPLKKNNNSAQSISSFSPISQIHSQLPSSSYQKYQIFDNGTCSSVTPGITYNNTMTKPIQEASTYNNLSEYSTTQNASLIYSTWIKNSNEITSINNTEYNGNEIQTINNNDYNRNEIPSINNSEYNNY